MTTYTIEQDIDIDAPVEVVWRTITEPDQIVRWFSDAVDVEARPGASGTVTFRGDGSGEPFVVNVAVVAVDRPNRYSFRWSHPSGDSATPANSTLVTFTLVADGAERTRLRVEETGLDNVDWPEERRQDYADEHRAGWQTLGGRLRDLFTSA